MSEYMSDRMPGRMSEKMSDRMSARTPDEMSEYMSDTMPGRMPNRMSEFMSDRMSLFGGHSKKVIVCHVHSGLEFEQQKNRSME